MWSLFSRKYPREEAKAEVATTDLTPPLAESTPATHPATMGVYVFLAFHLSMAASVIAYVPPRSNKSDDLLLIEPFPVIIFSATPMDAPRRAPETDAHTTLDNVSRTLFLLSSVHIKNFYAPGKRA
ncbi:hypothetical protein NEOKW01_0378 [Nematocida sp. AWRm80]|nr:hypothetical protein NEOKW01_0378 [Nematocida sp. AWRm80]